MVDDESEVISIYYGADTEEAEAEELATALEEAYPDCDVELNAVDSRLLLCYFCRVG